MPFSCFNLISGLMTELCSIAVVTTVSSFDKKPSIIEFNDSVALAVKTMLVGYLTFKK